MDVVVDVDLSVDGDVDVGVLRVDKATSIPDATMASICPILQALDVTSARPLATTPVGVHEIVNAKSAHLHTSQRRLVFRAAVTWAFCSRTGT